MIALSTALLASLLGSVHCAAMCGALSTVAGQGRRFGLQVRYHGARIAAYGVLGTIAGAIGRGVDSLGALAGIEQAALVTAIVVIVASFATTLVRPGAVPTVRWLGSTRTYLQGVLRTSTSAGTRAVLLGLLTALVPCGWLYAWVATAAASGSAERGAAVMVVFGLGAVPALVSAQSFARWMRSGPLSRMPRLSTALVAALLIATAVVRGNGVARLHHALASPDRPSDAPLVCHGGLQ